MTLNFIQESATGSVDTLTQSYSDRWEGVQGLEQTSGFMQFMASNDLIFVVLGVSLIIWFVLLFYLVKIDRNVSKLEESIKEENSNEA
jgi:hypothetical protein